MIPFLAVVFLVLSVGGGYFLWNSKQLIAQQYRPECEDDNFRTICYELQPGQQMRDFFCEGEVDSYGVCSAGDYKEYALKNHTTKSLFVPVKTANEWFSFKDATKPAAAKVESVHSKKQLARQQNLTFDENNDYYLTENARLHHDPDNGDDGVVICEVGVDECGSSTTVGYCDEHAGGLYDLPCWLAADDYTEEPGTEYEVQWFKTAPEDWKAYGTLTVDPTHSSFDAPNEPFGEDTFVGLLTDGSWARYSFTNSPEFVQAEYNNSAINLGGRRVRVVKDGVFGPWNYVVTQDPADDINTNVRTAGYTAPNVEWNLVNNDLTEEIENGQYFHYEVTRCDVTGSPSAQCCVSASGGNCVVEESLAIVTDGTEYLDTSAVSRTGDPQEFIYCVSPLNPAEIIDTADDPNPLKWNPDPRPRDCASRITY